MDYRNAFDLTGSVAVISGGSRGIGYESAVALGSCGAKVILASRDQSALNTAVKRLAETAVDATCAVVDVTDPNAAFGRTWETNFYIGNDESAVISLSVEMLLHRMARHAVGTSCSTPRLCKCSRRMVSVRHRGRLH